MQTPLAILSRLTEIRHGSLRAFVLKLRVVAHSRMVHSSKPCLSTATKPTTVPAQASGQRPWNEAASLLVVAPMNNSEPYSLGYLLLERSRTSRVMPGSFVFPGGNVDKVDTHPKWVDLFKDIRGIDITQESFLQKDAHIPEIYREQPSHTQIPKQVSLRITAIRETFEEAGVLICKRRQDESGKVQSYEFSEMEDKTAVKTWQKRIRKSSEEFLELCKELDCVPDIHALHEWNNWLTPTTFKPKSRFDTMFYMIILPKLPAVVIDAHEAVKAQWVAPSAILSDHEKGETRLMPPQVYEFTRLAALKTIKDLQDRLLTRRNQGIERYFPVVRKAKDGALFILPGDDLYPNSPDYLGAESGPIKEIPNTIAELKESSKNFHRGIAKQVGLIGNYEINVTRYGHVY